MSPTRTQISHFLAKALFINLNYRNEPEEVFHGDDSALSVSTTDTFVEEEPTAVDWIRKTLPTRSTFVNYFKSLFPFTKWILHYNVQWLLGDLIAGEHHR